MADGRFCINCGHDLDRYGLECPYCHRNPLSGGEPTILTPGDDDGGTGGVLPAMLLGVGSLFIFPPAAILFFGAAAGLAALNGLKTKEDADNAAPLLPVSWKDSLGQTVNAWRCGKCGSISSDIYGKPTRCLKCNRTFVG